MDSKIVQIRTVEHLRQIAQSWNDLWHRSDATMPTLRAEPLALWLEQFAPQARLCCLCVEDNGRLTAALPLVETKVARLIGVGGLPANEWMCSGELLLDTSVDAARVLDTLVGGFGTLPWQCLWLDAVVLDTPRSDAFLAALGRSKLATSVQHRFQIGKIDGRNGWEEYLSSLSKNHRRKMRKCRNRLQQLGTIEFVTHQATAPADVKRLLRRAFEMEDRSWKGEAGTSVLRTDGMFDYLVRQADILAESGHIQISFLECAQRPIAFAYGWTAKGVYHSYKIGYDEEFAACSPGHLLRQDLLEHFFTGTEIGCFDCMGELNEASSRWTTGQYGVARVVTAQRLLGRLFMLAYRRAWPLLRRIYRAV